MKIKNWKIIIVMLFMFLLSNISISQSYFYSFENTFSGWDTTGIDLQLGDTTIAWSIHPVNELAIDSSFSMRYYLENYNDAGKIWIQRAFNVEQHKDYMVTIDYKFASRDFGMANLWTIITGVHLSPPTNAQELMYQGHTGNGFDFDTGYVWLDKNYEFFINSDTSNALWIVIGIWGNWEAPRTYYLDSLSIRIQEDNPNNLPHDGLVETEFYLHQNYPNPFNPTTTIEYTIPRSVILSGAKNLIAVQLKVYDVIGKEVATLVNEEKSVGSYKVEFDGSGLTSGIYFYQLDAGNLSQAKKLLLLK